MPPLTAKAGSSALAHLQNIRRINHAFNIDYQKQNAFKYYDLQSKNMPSNDRDTVSQAQIPMRNLIKLADRQKHLKLKE